MERLMEAKPNKDDMDGGFEVASSDYQLVKDINKSLQASRNHLKKWKDNARESYDFFAGNQWAAEDVQSLNKDGRPVIVFNRIPRVINAVHGLEVQNRQEVTYLPRTNGDVGVSDLLTGAANWVRDSCDAEDEESQAFKDCLMTGMGFTETRLDYEVDPDGAIIIDRVDPLDMLYDPTSQKRNLDDANWIARVKYYDKKDFIELWPEAEDEVQMDFSQDPKGMQPHDATLAPFYINDQSSDAEREDDDMIQVVQYQYWIRETFYRVELLDGKIEEYDRKEFRKNRKLILATAPRYQKQTRKKYMQMFLVGDYILEKGECPVNGFTLRAITGLVDHTDGVWFGLIQLMKDPQRWANKWLSQTLHIVNSNAKGGYFAEEDAFVDNRQAEKSISSVSITWLAEGGMGKIQKKEPPIFPSQIDSMLQYAVNSIAEIVGVNLEMLGMANREQSGVLERERKQTAITVVADFFDSLRRYRKEEGRILADFIIEYIADSRLIRIAGNGLGEYVPLEKDKLSFKYDIVVDESPTSPNQRELVFDRLVTLFPILLQANIPIPQDILDYAPLPAQLIGSWKKEIEAANAPNPEAEAYAKKEKELRMQLAELEAKLKAADVEDTQASAFEKQTKSALNISKSAHEESLAGLDKAKDARENFKTTLDVFKNL